MIKKYKNIFVVDDDEVTNFVTEKLLHQFDKEYKIFTYTKPTEAFSKLAAFKEEDPDYPDMILLDINMPGINGFEFLEKMKEIGLSSKIQVIMYSSSGNTEDKKKSSAFSNVIGYLEKPFTASAYGRILDKTPY